MSKKKTEDFVHLHVHSDMSQLDGCGKIDDYVEHVAKIGGRAIAFTEHGSMRGYRNAHVAAEKAGIKPIHGVEFYVANDMHRKGLTSDERESIGKGLKAAEKKAEIKAYEEREGIRDRWHLTVWAKDDVGLKNLYKLTSSAYLDGFYYKPRIDMPALLKHGDGLMVASGCMSSVIYDRVVAGKRKKAFSEADVLFDRFGEDFWIEVQPHNMEEQTIANKFGLELRDRYANKSRLLATQDAHYVKHSDACHHDVLLCIGTRGLMNDPHRWKFSNDEFFMKNRKQMRKSFLEHHGYMKKKQIKESLDSTILFSEKITTRLVDDHHAALLPDIELPKGYKNEWEYLKGLCFEGWQWRGIDRRAETVAKRQKRSCGSVVDEYKRRLIYEMNQLKRQHFVGYFLMVHDIYSFARGSRIMVGPGRGSVAGSLVAYLMGLTAVDPIEHGLIFERFINPGRIDMPDIDMDFEDGRRHEIFQYLRDKYGEARCAQIATIGKLSGKQCLRDISRVFSVPLPEVNEVSKSIIERSSGDERASQTIADSFKEFAVCKTFNKKYPQVLKHAERLEGMAKNLGIHAAGVVVTPEPVVNYVPLEVRKNDGEDIVVTALDKKGIQSFGLVKLDVLGLKTLTILRETCEGVEENTGKWIDLEKLDLNDMKVLDGFTRQDFPGIFQYDTPSAAKVCTGVNFEAFENIAAMTALNRPGTSRSGLAAQYVARKKDPKKIKEDSMHAKVTALTADTLGIIVYQEHVIKIFTDIAGFSPADADSLRSLIGKSKGDEAIKKERKKFLDGTLKNNKDITLKQAEKIFDAITFFGSYGFNKSHATAYGMIAYWGMWMKTYYPLEFYCALLKNEPDRVVIQRIAKDAREKGIKLIPPDISKSKKYFSMDISENAIRGSLIDIKKVGDSAADTIVKNQPYKSFTDFAERIDRRRCNRGAVGSLIISGAMSSLVPNAKWLIENLETVWNMVPKKKYKEIEELLVKSKKEKQYAKEEAQLLASSVSPLSSGKHPVTAYSKFIKKKIKVPLTGLDSETFFDDYNNKSVFLVGVIIDTKYNLIGDFHTGPRPSEEEMKEKKWGARYANVNIESVEGTQERVKFDIDVFDSARHVIDSGAGTPVVVHVNVNAPFKKLRANFVINLETYRKNVRDKNKLTLHEKIVAGKHPIIAYKWKTEKKRKERVTNKKFHESPRGGTYCGLVTHLKTQKDKRGSEMAFFGLTGVDSHLEVICFGSNWAWARKDIEVGALLEIAIEKKPDRARGLSYFYSGGGVRKLKSFSID